MDTVLARPRVFPVGRERWLILLALLVPFVFHGCHLGGHDDDLLKLRPPPLRVR